MAYLFPHIDHKIYPKTFLKNVVLIIEWKGISSFAEHAKPLQNFFAENFSINVPEEDLNSHNAIDVNSSNNLILFRFATDSFRLEIKHPAYRSFAQIEKWFTAIGQFLSIFGVAKLSLITLSKSDEIEYLLQTPDNLGKAITQFFSKELLDESKEHTAEKYEAAIAEKNNWNANCIFPDEESDTAIEINFGFRKEIGNPRKGYLYLNSSVHTLSEDIPASDIFNNIPMYNSWLDNAFHWSITEFITKHMESNE